MRQGIAQGEYPSHTAWRQRLSWETTVGFQSFPAHSGVTVWLDHTRELQLASRLSSLSMRSLSIQQSSLRAPLHSGQRVSRGKVRAVRPFGVEPVQSLLPPFGRVSLQTSLDSGDGKVNSLPLFCGSSCKMIWPRFSIYSKLGEI